MATSVPINFTTDGSTFQLRGHITSGNLRGAVFAGTYDVSSRSGRRGGKWLMVGEIADDAGPAQEEE